MNCKNRDVLVDCMYRNPLPQTITTLIPSKVGVPFSTAVIGPPTEIFEKLEDEEILKNSHLSRRLPKKQPRSREHCRWRCLWSGIASSTEFWTFRIARRFFHRRSLHSKHSNLQTIGIPGIERAVGWFEFSSSTSQVTLVGKGQCRGDFRRCNPTTRSSRSMQWFGRDCWYLPRPEVLAQRQRWRWKSKSCKLKNWNSLNHLTQRCNAVH